MGDEGGQLRGTGDKMAWVRPTSKDPGCFARQQTKLRRRWQPPGVGTSPLRSAGRRCRRKTGESGGTGALAVRICALECRLGGPRTLKRHAGELGSHAFLMSSIRCSIGRSSGLRGGGGGCWLTANELPPLNCCCCCCCPPKPPLPNRELEGCGWPSCETVKELFCVGWPNRPPVDGCCC